MTYLQSAALLPQLKALCFPGSPTALVQAVMKTSFAKGLQQLLINHSGIGDNEISALIQACPSLQRLDIMNSKVSIAGIERLQDLPHLQRIACNVGY